MSVQALEPGSPVIGEIRSTVGSSGACHSGQAGRSMAKRTPRGCRGVQTGVWERRMLLCTASQLQMDGFQLFLFLKPLSYTHGRFLD